MHIRISLGALFTIPAAAALTPIQERILTVPFALLFFGLAVYAYLAARHAKESVKLPAPPPPEYAELEQHVSKLTDQGMAHEAIRDKLIGAGWEARKVDLVLHNAHRPDQSIEKLMFYVQDQFRRQKPKEEIRNNLLNAHWDGKLVSLVLE